MLLFRLPFGNGMYTVIPSSETVTVRFNDFENCLNLQFSGSLSLIQEHQTDTLLSDAVLPPFTGKEDYETHESYSEKINLAIAAIKNQRLQKLVLSRRIPVFYNTIDLKKSFLNLCSAYPNAFAYLFLNGKDCWLGAFSEILGKFSKVSNEFETMSLAGTLPLNEAWTQKEIEEQRPVTDYISDVLKSFSKQIEVSETYDHISGSIKHLRTDFKASISPADLDDIIRELHPTPAVCGIPKETCRNLIRTLEKQPREFYAGYSRIETVNEIYYFVNLRCAKLYHDRAEIFAGGGITAQSNPEKEWTETELKSRAIRNNLATA